jgi:hypothetical protein
LYPLEDYDLRVPIEVSYRDVPKTEFIEKLIEEKATKLEQVCEHLMSCRVALECPQKHQQSGSPFRIRILMRVPPGHELVVTRESSQGYLHEPLESVVRNAFDAARLQLSELVERQRGDVKIHP